MCKFFPFCHTSLYHRQSHVSITTAKGGGFISFTKDAYVTNKELQEKYISKVEYDKIKDENKKLEEIVNSYEKSNIELRLQQIKILEKNVHDIQIKINNLRILNSPSSYKVGEKDISETDPEILLLKDELKKIDERLNILYSKL